MMCCLYPRKAKKSNVGDTKAVDQTKSKHIKHKQVSFGYLPILLQSIATSRLFLHQIGYYSVAPIFAAFGARVGSSFFANTSSGT